MRSKKVLTSLLGLGRAVVILGWTLHEGSPDERPRLEVRIRQRSRRKGNCGRCGAAAPFYDRGDGQRSWRHLDCAMAVTTLVADAPRVCCPEHGPTVAQVPWARHDSAFTRAFEDVVVHDAVVSSKQAAADRYGISWRAVNNACVRVATEAMGRSDMLEGLVAIAIDEVKYKKGQRYLTMVSDHLSGKVVWAAPGRSKDTLQAFFTALGDERAARLAFISCDGADWVRNVVAERAPQAVVCLDTFHVVGWATEALDEVRRSEWNALRRGGGAKAAKELKGLRWVLLRNWEHLSPRQKSTIRELGAANRRLLRAWQLKEELREVFALPLLAARRALDNWLCFASRSRLEPFVRLARTIRRFRRSIEATIEWKLTNGLAESNNASAGRIRTSARGFQQPEAFITMILLDRGGLAPPLPWPA